MNVLARYVIGAYALAATVLSSTVAEAADYPSETVSITVPFAPGGPTDVSARIVAKALTEELGSPFIVENVPGAGSVIGTNKIARAKPDGYSLLWATGSALAMAPHLNPAVKYDPVKSFEPVSLVSAAPFVLVVRPSLGVKSLDELVKFAQANPGKLNYGSTGVGGSAHMITEYFKATVKISAVHVAFKGGAPMMAALAGGEIDFAFDTPTTVAPLVAANRVLPLAVTSLERWPGLPDVKTLDELGVTGFDATAWFGLLAPQGTPADRVLLLNRKIAEALKKPEIRQSLQTAGFFVQPTSPEGFAKKIAAEHRRWGDIVKSANITIK